MDVSGGTGLPIAIHNELNHIFNSIFQGNDAKEESEAITRLQRRKCENVVCSYQAAFEQPFCRYAYTTPSKT